MSKFNSGKSASSTKTINHEGEVDYQLSPEMELYTSVVTTALGGKFYESADERIERVRNLVSKVDPEFVARLAVYAREKMHLRSIPLVLCVELAKVHSGDSLVSRTVGRVVQRADEITELLAYYQIANERTDTKKLNKLSKQIQKGLEIAFNKFDEYQFAKYNRDGEISLRDALFIVHPKAKDKEQQKLFDAITDNKLETPYTWEVELSNAGKVGREKKDVWEELIGSGKVGYMALLRNLRNILEADVSGKSLEAVLKTISDPEKVRKSKQLPVRFLSAYRELSKVSSPKVSAALNDIEEAVLHTAENIKGYDIDTSVLIACDVSGSMFSKISPNSSVMNYDIGLMLGMLLQNRCRSVITGIFGDSFLVAQMPQKQILGNVTNLQSIEGKVGYSTNGYRVIDDMISSNTKVDKVMMFTDCQMWDSYGMGSTMKKSWAKYKSDVNPNAKMYLFDLAGYGNTPLSIHSEGVYCIAGWSDKVFDVLHAIDEGSSALQMIKSIDL